ncbi:histidine kinase [Novipirellula aureliae]|nr:histidine kinase [Novipirellula aureliae]
MTEANSPSVVFLSGDLMFASRVRGAAEQSGYQFRFGASLPEGDLSSVKFVIVDLATRSKLIPTIVSEVVNRCGGARLIAYAPHVQMDRIKAAREAGVPVVLTRGQLDGSLGTLFSDLPK